MMCDMRFVLLAMAFALAALPRVSVGDVDFIRGDINGDGVVTISDSYRFFMWYSNGYEPPLCMETADVDDNGRIEWADSFFLLQAQYVDGLPIPPPFPDPGQDLTDDLDPTLDCKAYGGEEVLEDFSFELKVLDATVPGGDDSRAFLEIALNRPESSPAIAAVSGQIRILDPIVQDAPLYESYGTASVRSYLHSYNLGGEDLISFGNMRPPDYYDDSEQHLWNDNRWMKIVVCLKEGTPAGEYPMILESAELTDAQTGRAMIPLMEGGTLLIEEAVTGAGTFQCVDIPSPPDRPSPETVKAAFLLASATAVPGSSVTLPFTIWADEPVEGFQFSIDFDEEVLQVLSAEFAWQKFDGSEYFFSKMEINNQNDNPGSAGIDEGFITGAALFDRYSVFTMPANQDHLALNIRFQVHSEASTNITKIRFLDRDNVRNVLTTHAFSVTPDIANSFTLLNGRIGVIPDIATFFRGDSNGDGEVDLSDALRTLEYLFLSGRPPACFDAADFNDDGRIDLSDPIATLEFLFLDRRKVPPLPFPAASSDPTEDSMGCLWRE